MQHELPELYSCFAVKKKNKKIILPLVTKGKLLCVTVTFESSLFRFATMKTFFFFFLRPKARMSLPIALLFYIYVVYLTRIDAYQ